MFYAFDLAIPAQITQASPQKTTLKLTHGIIHRISVGFPDGCAGLAHVQLYRHEHQVWPTNPGASFNWNDVNIEWSDYFELLTGPYVLKAWAWNDDDSYQHTISVRIGVLPPEAYWKTGPTVAMENRLKKAFGV